VSDDDRPKLPVAPTTATTRSEDRAVIVGEVGSDDQKAFAVLRRRSADAPVEAGLLRGLREGQPITGEVVKLTQTNAESPVFDVDVQLAAPTTTASLAATHKGPTRVTSDAYRSGWDEIFGDPAVDRSTLN
jgi:hypothetical protein